VALPACHSFLPGPGNIERTATSGWIGRRVGCFDLHVAAAHDPVAPASATVLAFDFVNTCNTEQAIDFTALTGHADLADRGSVKLGVYDPAREIRPATLIAGGEGAESIELDPPAGHGAAPLSAVRAVCLDVSGLAKHASAVSEACFLLGPAGLVPAEGAVALPTGSQSSLPSREVSVTVGYRHLSRFGAGWDGRIDGSISSSFEPLGHVHSDFDVAATQSGLLPSQYRSGSLLAPGDTETSGARSLGCLDVRVEAVMAHVAKTSVALAFMVGNRCSGAVPVALGRATVRAAWAGAGDWPLALYDPASEVNEPVLGPRADATELLEYLEPADAPAGPAQSVCVDVSRVDAAVPAHEVPPICFTRTGRFANETTIVGHQFFEAGNWAQASPFFHVFFETGASLNFVDPRIGGFATTPWSGTAPDMSHHDLATPAFKKTATLAWDLRYGWVLGHGYAGLMLRAGAGAVDSNVPIPLDGAPGRSDSSITDLSVALLGGYVLTDASSPTRVRADLALGGRALEVLAFTPGCRDSSCAWRLDSGWLLIEPRLAIDRWLSPWWSVSTTVTVDALHVPNFGVGVSFTFHLWGYDGG
jgi:hypothetical protein